MQNILMKLGVRADQTRTEHDSYGQDCTDHRPAHHSRLLAVVRNRTVRRHGHAIKPPCASPWPLGRPSLPPPSIRAGCRPTATSRTGCPLYRRAGPQRVIDEGWRLACRQSPRHGRGEAGAAGTPKGQGRPRTGAREAGPQLPAVRSGGALGPGHRRLRGGPPRRYIR